MAIRPLQASAASHKSCTLMSTTIAQTGRPLANEKGTVRIFRIVPFLFGMRLGSIFFIGEKPVEVVSVSARTVSAEPPSERKIPGFGSLYARHPKPGTCFRLFVSYSLTIPLMAMISRVGPLSVI